MRPVSNAPQMDSVEVVVIDRFTAEPLVAGPAGKDSDLSIEEVHRAEHHAPEGISGTAHEQRVTPWLMGSLAIGGLVIVCASMYAVGGVQAAAVGAAWLVAGYAAAWSVVWGAGLLRARDEQAIETRLHKEHGHLSVK